MLKTLALASIAVSLIAGPVLAADSSPSMPASSMSAPASSTAQTAAQKKAELKAEKAKEKKTALREKQKKEAAPATSVN